MDEQLVLQTTKLNRYRSETDLMSTRVDLERADAQHPHGWEGSGTTQQRLEACTQLEIGDGLGDEVVCTKLEGAQQLKLSIPATEHYCRQLPRPDRLTGRLDLTKTYLLEEVQRTARRLEPAEDYGLGCMRTSKRTSMFGAVDQHRAKTIESQLLNELAANF
jgi:hypothetical protein